MIPAHLLNQTVTRVQPAVSTDDYGNTVYDYNGGATRTSLAAWLQQDQRTQLVADGASPLQGRWLMMTNTPIGRRDRIEWVDSTGETITFHVDGPTEPAYTPAGYHHQEITLRVVDG